MGAYLAPKYINIWNEFDKKSNKQCKSVKRSQNTHPHGLNTKELHFYDWH